MTLDRRDVTPGDISELTRRLAEAGFQARLVHGKLQATEGPLAMLAALRMEAVVDELETMLERLVESSDVFLSIVERAPES